MATDDVPHGRGRAGRSGFPLWPGRQSGRFRTALMGVVLVGYAWAAGATAPFSTISLICVLVPGVVLAAIAYWWPPERIQPPDKLDITGVSYWAIAVAALFEWEASAFRDNSLPWHPSLTGLIDPLIQPHPVRGAAFLVWLLAGWALVRR